MQNAFIFIKPENKQFEFKVYGGRYNVKENRIWDPHTVYWHIHAASVQGFVISRGAYIDLMGMVI